MKLPITATMYMCDVKKMELQGIVHCKGGYPDATDHQHITRD